MDVYALDFDGIICDSCGESSQSAIKVVALPQFCFIVSCLLSHETSICAFPARPHVFGGHDCLMAYLPRLSSGYLSR